MENSRTFTFALLAGILGSCGSICGKLSGTVSDLLSEFEVVSLLAQGSFFILMILANTLGCTFYAKSLDVSVNSLQPTVVSCAANYLFSAFAGFLLFNEVTSRLWWLGTSLIFTGLVVVLKNMKEYTPSKHD